MNQDQRSFWTFAASFGALWGALEATVGTFLHALKVPFAGVFLASMGAALLVALRTLCPRRGILLATGAICAGVKLAAPSTTLLGPAVGILVESLLAELVMLPLGANPLSAALAGGLGALWSVCQKVLTQIVLYGEPIVALYKEVLQRGSKILGVAPSAGLRLVLGFVALLIVWGTLAALCGLRAGRRALRGELVLPELASDEPIGAHVHARERSARWRRVLLVALAIAELVLLVKAARPVHLAGGVLLIAIARGLTRDLTERIGSLKSWAIAFVVLATLGAMLGPKSGVLSVEGVQQALTMIARALTLVLLCQALLSLLPPPRADGSAFARALGAALASLPQLSRTLGAALTARRNSGVRSPLTLLLGLLDDTVALAAHGARAPDEISDTMS